MNKEFKYYKGNKIEKRKRINDSMYKNSLIIISAMVLFFVVIAIIFIFAKGISGFFNFDELSFKNFLFGNYYDGKTAFAAGFMVVNTVWTTFLAILIALPISVFTALFVTRVLKKSFRILFLSVISILAAIPTVIYGAFGMSVIDSLVVNIFNSQPGVLLSIVITISFMIMPTITLLTITTISNVDRKMEQSALALGATRSQTSMKITIRAAIPGIIVATLLGVGRAMGEATAVSMVASQSNSGPTFWLFDNIRLLTATMLTGWGEFANGSVEQANVFAMGSILLIAISLVFLAMKLLRKQLDPINIAKNNSKKMHEINSAYDSFKNKPIENLTLSEQKIISKNELKEFNIKKYEKNEKLLYELAQVSSVETINKSTNSYKKKQSFINNSILFIFSIIGIILLISIIGFLFVGGFDVLTWDYLSSKSSEVIIINEQYINIYGLAIPIFGTLITILSTLIIAVPIGVMIGVMFGVYVNPSTKFGSIATFGIELLTGIPALIYGIIGSILFLPLANSLGMTSLAGALIMMIFVLPTIIKNTQQGIDSINKSQTEGSLGLGATKFITTTKVLLKQSYNEIISATIIAAGLIMADSAIFIILYGTSSATSGVDWLVNGGTTLSTEIYKLTKLEEIPWEYVKAIGIVIISFIISLSFIANLIRERKIKEFITFSSGFFVVILSILLSLFWMFIIGLIIMLFLTSSIFIYEYFNNKYNLNRKFIEYKENLIFNWKVK